MGVVASRLGVRAYELGGLLCGWAEVGLRFEGAGAAWCAWRWCWWGAQGRGVWGLRDGWATMGLWRAIILLAFGPVFCDVVYNTEDAMLSLSSLFVLR